MRPSRTLLLAAVALGGAFLAGCGRAAGGPGGEGDGAPWAAESAAEPGDRPNDAAPGLETVAALRKLRPLSNADVRLYADVMTAAVARLDHPTAEDRRVLAQTDAVERGVAARDPAALAVAAEATSRALTLRTRMDDEIVRQRHIDARWYALVRARIESVIHPVAAYGDGGAATVPVSGAQNEFDRLSEERRKADAALLAPRRAELQRLIRRVRMPTAAN